jgi:DNA polymerase delta subunit 1
MSIICHAYDSEFMQAGDQPEGLHLWCLGRNSEPIHILIKEAPVYLYIELPESIAVTEWNSDFIDLLYEDFRQIHGKCAPFMMEFTERQKLYYFRGEHKTYMARLYFRTSQELFYCTKRLMKMTEYPNFGNLNFRIFEKDISVRRKVFTMRKTRYCQWFRLDNAKEVFPGDKDRMAIPGPPNRPIREFISKDFDDIFPIPTSESSSWISKPRVLSFDIETYTDNHHSLPDKTNPNHVIWMISCLFQITGEKESRDKYIIQTSDCEEIPGVTIIKAKNEEDMLIAFLDLIDHLDPEIIMGYNIFAYDYPYIDARFSMFRESYEPCSRLEGYIPEFKLQEWNSGAYGQMTIAFLKMPGRISIDLFPLIKRDYKFDKYTLDFVSQTLLGSSKHDVTHIEMFEAFESKDIAKMTRVTKYCVQDSDLVLDLYEKMNVWIGLVEMANIVGVEIMEIFTRGQQIRCVSQIYDLTHRNQIVLDSRDTVEMEYEGGFVGEPIVGLHEDVIVLDFSSLYPSIMRAYNICYTTLVPEIDIDDYNLDDINVIDAGIAGKFYFVKDHIRKGILPQLVENLVNERNAVRGEMKKISKKIEELKASEGSLDLIKQLELTLTVLDKRQNGLKVSANSMYGFLGVQTGGKLPLMEGAISITAKGRQLINEVNDFLVKEYQATIVYNDTDSSMVTLPIVKSRAEANAWGHKLAEIISGKPEVRNESGELVKAGIKGLFPPPLKMEFEKAMRMLCVTKKKYAGFLIEDDGSFKLDKRGEPGDEEIYKRGIVIARRDNYPYLRKVYTNVLRSVLRRNPIEDTFKMILDAVVELLSGKLPARGNLTFIRGIGAEYASDSYFMKVFSDELASKGHPVAPGDRLEYVIVKSDNPVLGKRMRLIEMYEDSINYDESKEGPRPDNVYPVEEIDYLYYLTNGMQNPVDQLFNAGYIDELYKTTLHDVGYKPKNSRSKKVNINTPIKMMTTIIHDKTRKGEFTLEQCLKFLEDEFYNWFLEQLATAEPLEEPVKVEVIGDDGGGDE